MSEWKESELLVIYNLQAETFFFEMIDKQDQQKFLYYVDNQ